CPRKNRLLFSSILLVKEHWKTRLIHRKAFCSCLSNGDTDKFVKIALFTDALKKDLIFPLKYPAYADVLHALSQVCVAYRGEYLSFLWEKLNLACGVWAYSNLDAPESLKCKRDGLLISPFWRPYIRLVKIQINRNWTCGGLRCTQLQEVRLGSEHYCSILRIRTLHPLYTDPQLSKHLRQDGVVLPSIPTLRWGQARPRYPKSCKKIEELCGFGKDRTGSPISIAYIGQSLAEAAPYLRVFDVWDTNYALFLEHISEFKKFNILIIKTSSTDIRFNKPNATEIDQKALLQKCIKDFRTKFENIPSCAERRRIRLLHALTYGPDGDRCWHILRG
ncbi:LOW QUALITY PROTEIN: hypothetical protein CVT25_002705, partial [Psilocybe cyanescens]